MLIGQANEGILSITISSSQICLGLCQAGNNYDIVQFLIEPLSEGWKFSGMTGRDGYKVWGYPKGPRTNHSWKVNVSFILWECCPRTKQGRANSSLLKQEEVREAQERTRLQIISNRHCFPGRQAHLHKGVPHPYDNEMWCSYHTQQYETCTRMSHSCDIYYTQEIVHMHYTNEGFDLSRNL